MKTANEKDISQEVKDFLQANLFSSSYSGIVHDYDYNGENLIDFNAQPEHIIKAAEKDCKILNDRAKKNAERPGFQVGQFINLPDGQMVIISHVWEDSVQTSGGGSMCLGSGGGLSYSGGLDSGISKKDLILTDETRKGGIWFFHEGRSGGNRGVNFSISFKVYRTEKGADLSGIPQVKALAKKKIVEQSETITRINGNGNSYKMHMPELTILNKDKTYPMQDTVISGLQFISNGWGNLTAQPMKLSEINKVLKENDFKADYHNNASHHNTLFLTPTKSDREIRREFPKKKETVSF